MHATMAVVTSSTGASSGSRAKAPKSRSERYSASSSERPASPKEKKISVRIREVVGNGEAESIQVCGHVAPDVSVGRHVVGESGGGGAQARNESRKTVLIVGWASRPVLEEMSSSWRLGYGIVEAMRGSVLGATLCKD